MPVRIYGTGFSPTAGNNSVTFGGTTATVDSAKSTVLYVQVPAGPSGLVDVSVDGATAASAFSVVTGGAASFANTRAELGGTELGSVEWADFNNDGALDLLVAGSDTNSAPSATVYLEDGSGGYTPADAGLTGVTNSASAVGDLDNDGNLDIVLTGSDENFAESTTVYLGDGAGGFSQAGAGLTGVRNGSVSLGDLNGDGNLDLVVTGQDDSSNRTTTVYLGDGTGGFSTAGAGLIGAQDGSSSIGDVDGDGNLDLVVTGATADGASTTVYLGDGNGSFSSVGAGLVGVQNSSSTMGDVDGDGILDLVLAGDDPNFNQTTVVYLGDGSGGFFVAEAGLPGVQDGSVTLGDVNGDSSLDLLLTGEHNGTPSGTVYLGETETGQFAESTAVLAGVRQSAAALADANGDGDLDIALAGATGLNDNVVARVYRNEAISAATSLGVSDLRPRSGAPGTTMQIQGSGFTSSTTVTFNGISATVASSTSTTLTVEVPTDVKGPVPVTVEESGTSVTAADRFTVVSGGSSTLTGVAAGIDQVSQNSSAAWGDFDEDGHLDLLLAGSGTASVYLRDGSGGFTPASAGLLQVDFSAADVGDVNRDGHLDFVLAGGEGGSGPITVVYLGDGTGGFTRAKAGLRGLEQGSLNLGDLNEDGNLDLLVTGQDTRGNPQTDVYLGYGDGQFTRSGAGLLGLDQSSLALGDLDGNGTLDLVVAGEDGSFTKQTKVYLGDGTGGFIIAEAGLTGVANGTLELGDVDEDGLLDLVLSGSDPNNNPITTVYLGDGTGQFSPVGAALPGTLDSSSDLGDVDGDGTLDLVLAGGFEGSSVPETALFIGDGGGNFTRAGLGMVGVRRGASELGDLDGDGDLDLLAAGGGRFQGTYVYQNEAISAETDLTASNLRPRSGTAGASVRVEGSGFTSSTTATLGGATATVSNATSTALTVDVPSGVRGPVPVTVDESGTSVAAADRFTVVEDDSATFSGVETNLAGLANGSAAWADFNEDGTLDLVTSAGTVYLGNETGFFSKAEAGLSGASAAPLAVGDVNGDGHLDIVLSEFVGDFTGNPTSVYLGDGTGGFTKSPAVLPGLRDGSATLGDLDNDGNLDLVLTGSQGTGDPFAKVYLGYGDGRFAGTQVNLVPVMESSTNLADLDGDGNLDLVATGDSTGNGAESTSIYLGDGTGGLTRQGLGLTGVQDGSSNVGDFDNDGNLDLLITGRTQNSNESATVYLGDGTGGFSPAGASLTSVDRSSSDVGDVNGDGNLDLALTGFNTDNIEVSKIYLGDGTGNFSDVGAGLAGVNDGSSDFGDLDGDGELDLVVTGFDTDGNPASYLYENGPLASPPLRVTGLQPQSAAPSESIRIYGTAFDTSNVSNNIVSFGGTQATASSATATSLTVSVPSGVSGAVDVTVTTPDSSVTASDRFTVVTGGGTTYAPIGNLPDVEDGSLNWADFNNDGALDLFVSGDSTGNGDLTAAVYLGDGTGSFTKMGAGLTGVERSASAVGDLNNDGTLDLVVTGDDESGSFSTTVYLGDGAGGFTSIDSGLPNVADESVSLGDLDGDGNLDLILTGGDRAGVYFGDGEGRFIDAGVGLSSFSDGSSAIGDVNGDNNLDFVVTGNTGFDPTATMYLGDGSGGFTTAGAGINGVDFGTTDFSDVNGDGNLDLLVTGDSTSSGDLSTVLYLGDGSGGFSVANAGLTGVVNSSVEIGDLDGDGNRDLLVTGDSTGSDEPSTTLYRGDGTGSFTAADAGFEDIRDGSAALGDLDGDGDLDPALNGRVEPSSTSERRTVVYQNESITAATGLAVTNLRPHSGPPGTIVRIEGSGFSTTPSDNTVTFGDVEATVTRATTTSLTVEVPSGVSGRVPLSVSGTTAPDHFSVVTGGNTSFASLDVSSQARQRGAVEWGDFDEDGTLDLLAAGDTTTEASYATTLSLGDGNGGFTTADAGLIDVGLATSDIGDVNADGHLDLVLTGQNSEDFRPTTAVYLGDGASGLSRAPASLPGVAYGSATFGDVNGDGHLDLVLTGRNVEGNRSAMVYLGYGDGRFTRANAGVAGVEQSAVAMGDANSDDNLDLVVTGVDTGATRSARVYLGDGSGGFNTAGSQLTGVEFGSVNLGDIDEDGNPDLFVTGLDESGSVSARVYLGDGTGGFSEAGAGLTGVVRSTSDLGDINGDGVLDILLSGQSETSVVTEILFGDGTGGFTRAAASDNLGGVVSGASALGDLGGNGTLDFFVTGLDDDFSGALTSALYVNEATTPPDPPTDLTAAASPARVDLGWTASDSTDVETYLVYRDTAPIDSSAGPSGRTPLDSTGASTTSYIDSSLTGGTTYYYRTTAVDTAGNQSSFSGEAQAFPSVPLRITQMQPTNGAPGTPVRIYGSGFSADAQNNSLTMDGISAPIDSTKTNVIYAQVPSGVSGVVSVSVTAFESSATAAEQFTVASGGGPDFSALGAVLTGVDLGGTDWGDYNGDGAPDLVVTGTDSNDTEIARIYRNDGDGSFTPIDAGIAGVRGPAAWGDYNHDGALDLVVVGADTSGASTATIYRNEGNDTFTAIDAGLIGVASSSVAWGDYNGDGTLDLAIIGLDDSNTRSARVYRNEGSGSFAPIEAGLTGVRSGDVAWGDYNGDGALDLAVIGTDTNNLKSTRVYRNDGNDAFTDIGASLTGVNLGSVAWGDHNGDGLLDLVLTGEDSDFIRHTTIYQNNGDGTFGSIGAGLTGVTFGDVAWGDYNADGTLDLVVIGDSTGTVQAGGGTATIYQNDGNGAFSRVGAGLRGVEAGSVGWSDATQDGALDLVVTGLDNDSNLTAAVYQNGTGPAVPPSNLSVSATSVVDSSATLQASVDPGDNSTTVTFEYGLDASYGQTETGTESPILGTGEQSDSAEVGGLLPGTEYHYRAIASNSVGADTTADQTFVTDPSPPVAVTDSASGITDTSATVYGTVNPGGDTTVVVFQYYPSDAPGQADTAAAAIEITGTQDTVASTEVTGLDPGSSYAYAAVAGNEVDTTSGETKTFATNARPPVSSIEAATSIADSSATLHASVNPNGDTTTVTFRYGTDTGYGKSVAGTESPLLGIVEQPDSAGVVALLPGTEYHYRAIASNSVGADTTADQTFVTDPSPPVAVTDSASGITDTSATVYGTVNPGGATTTTQFRFYPQGEASAADTVQAVENPMASTSSQSVHTSLEDLKPGRTYRFQVLAENEAGSSAGDEGEFMTDVLPPTARNDSARIRRGAACIFTVLANDDAGAGLDTASVSVASEPDHGTATVDGSNGTISYVHDGSDSVSDSFTYTVTDTTGQQSEPATVVIDVFGVAVQAEASLSEGATISLTAEGNFVPEEGTLFARIGGTTSYREIALTETGTDPLQLSTTIPDSLVTTRGIDYYAVLFGTDEAVTVPAGGVEAAQRQPAHIPVQFSELEVPVSVQPETYRMMSVSALPREGIKAALEQNYGDYDPGEWRVLRWDPAQGAEGDYREYPSIDSLRPGEGFWLITSEGRAFSLGSGRTAEASVARKVPLKAGWNQLGSPFTYAVQWDAILAASGLSASEIDGPVAFSDSTYQYGQTALNPWEGSFVRVSEPDTLVVPPASASSQKDRKGGQAQSKGPVALRGSGAIGAPATGAPTRESSEVESSSSEQSRAEGLGDRSREASGEKTLPSAPGGRGPARTISSEPVISQVDSSATEKYTLRVGAWPTGRQPHRVWVGLRPKAKTGRDALDFAQAPPIERTVQLAVRETIGEESVPHAGSFKPPSEEGQTWELDLTNRSRHAQETRLRLKSQGNLPSGQKRYVMDLDEERRVAPGAQFNLESGEERRLKVIMGTEAFAKAESEGIELNTFKNELRGNYPNPFGKETTIAYSLKSGREVTIEIYDVLGRRVQTLVKGKRQEAGVHRVRWRVGGGSGAPAGSGVYFYRIEAGSFTETRKMVLVR